MTQESSHNLLNSKFLEMEEDCEETRSSSETMVDINRLFVSLSNQITMQNNQLQEQTLSTDRKMSSDFHSVIKAHDEFKQQVRTELDDL